MKHLALKAVAPITVDGVPYAAGECVAQLVLDCPLGALESLLRSGQVTAEEIDDDALLRGIEAETDDNAAATDGDEAETEDADGEENTEAPARIRRAVNNKKVVNLGLTAAASQALTAAGLLTVGDVREHLEAFESLDDVEGLTDDERQAAIAAVQ